MSCLDAEEHLVSGQSVERSYRKTRSASSFEEKVSRLPCVIVL